MFLCRPVTPVLYVPKRASTSRARGSRCGPFIVADAVVEHEDWILFLALMIPRAVTWFRFANAWR